MSFRSLHACHAPWFWNPWGGSTCPTAMKHYFCPTRPSRHGRTATYSLFDAGPWHLQAPSYELSGLPSGGNVHGITAHSTLPPALRTAPPRATSTRPAPEEAISGLAGTGRATYMRIHTIYSNLRQPQAQAWQVEGTCGRPSAAWRSKYG